jgi:hypothetical protein
MTGLIEVVLSDGATAPAVLTDFDEEAFQEPLERARASAPDAEAVLTIHHRDGIEAGQVVTSRDGGVFKVLAVYDPRGEPLYDLSPINASHAEALKAAAPATRQALEREQAAEILDLKKRDAAQAGKFLKLLVRHG